MSIIEFSHDRETNPADSSPELFRKLEQFGESEKLNSFCNYLRSAYGIPESVVRNEVKSRVAKRYNYQLAEFDNKIRARSMFVATFKYLGMLFYMLLFSKKHNRRESCLLMIDDIRSSVELDRFGTLIQTIGESKVIAVIKGSLSQKHPVDLRLKFLLSLRGFHAGTIRKVIYHELRLGLWVYLLASINTRVNCVWIGSRIINDYLYATTVCGLVKSKYSLQERPYETSAVKNWVLKSRMGCRTLTLQKNIFQYDKIFFFIDTDSLLSLGQQTANLYSKYGGRIEEIIPVGSLFMEYYWYKDPSSRNSIQTDVLLLGINTSNAYSRMDSYDGFMDDYYGAMEWLVRLKQEYPDMSIAIKHHFSAGEDDGEDQLIKDSGVEVIDKSKNSYELAFNTKCIVTYGSTMGFEMLGHGSSVIFLDPRHNNSFLPINIEEDGRLYRPTSYDQFKEAVKSIIYSRTATDQSRSTTDKYCLRSDSVSSRIQKLVA